MKLGSLKDVLAPAPLIQDPAAGTQESPGNLQGNCAVHTAACSSGGVDQAGISAVRKL